jgi:hypothetical protein
MAIHLLSVVGTQIDLIPHFIDHYRSLEIDSIILTVHQEVENNDRFYEIKEVCKHRGVSNVYSYIGPWNEDSNPHIFDAIKEKSPSDWYVIADIDELHLYPQSINELIYQCEQAGSDYVSGCYVDRISRDGDLSPFGKGTLWEQFPLGASILHQLTGAAINKVTLSRGIIRTCAGQHLALNGIGFPVDDAFTQIHHFRWDSSIIERLKHRIEKFESKEWKLLWPDYLLEMTMLIQYFSENNNKIYITNPRFIIGEGGNRYDLLECWGQIKEHAIALRSKN